MSVIGDLLKEINEDHNEVDTEDATELEDLEVEEPEESCEDK